MGRKSIVINLSAEEREYLETQTRASVLRSVNILKHKHVPVPYRLKQ